MLYRSGECYLARLGGMGAFSIPARRGLRAFFLIFDGSQTSAFFFTTAPHSVHLNRPFFGFFLATPFLQPI